MRSLLVLCGRRRDGTPSLAVTVALCHNRVRASCTVGACTAIPSSPREQDAAERRGSAPEKTAERAAWDIAVLSAGPARHDGVRCGAPRCWYIRTVPQIAAPRRRAAVKKISPHLFVAHCEASLKPPTPACWQMRGVCDEGCLRRRRATGAYSRRTTLDRRSQSTSLPSRCSWAKAVLRLPRPCRRAGRRHGASVRCFLLTVEKVPPVAIAACVSPWSSVMPFLG